MTEKGSESKLAVVLSFLLAALTLAIYWQVQDHEFVNYDDPVYITENPWVLNGLTWESVKWAFTTGYANFWHPLTWLTILLDVQLFELDPGMHIWMNVLIHTAGTVLLFQALRSMTGTVWKSALVAALFALHPLHVESVAWASERKDVLSGMFWMAALWAYAGYAQKPGWKTYSGVLSLFVLGSMAKPMLVTLPFVLLLLDYWPLGRMRFGWIDWTPSWVRTASTTRLVCEKIPILVLSALFSVVAFLAQQKGAVVPFSRLPMANRLMNSCLSYVAYIRKMIAPFDLAVRYPFMPISLPLAILCGILVLLVTVWTVQGIRRRPYWFVGWCWYLGVLVPVIGIIQIGGFAMADRFTYLPLVGLFIALVWQGEALLKRFASPAVPAAVAGAVLLYCTVLTTIQIGYWHDNISLYEHTMKLVRYNPISLNNMSVSLTSSGRFKEAEECARRAVEQNPDYAEAHNSLGNALMKQGKNREAEFHFLIATRLSPDFYQAHNNLAIVLYNQGKIEAAGKEYLATMKLNPTLPGVHFNYGNLLINNGRPAEAISQYREYLRLAPGNPHAEYALAKGLVMAGELDEAAAHYRVVLKIGPQSVPAHFEYGVLLNMQKKYREAIGEYREVLRLQPDHADAMKTLAWILAVNPDSSLRNGAEAVRLAKRSCELDGEKDPARLDTLAAALAEAGRFDEAAQAAEKAHALALADGQNDFAEKIRAHLELYRASKPLRDSN